MESVMDSSGDSSWRGSRWAWVIDPPFEKGTTSYFGNFNFFCDVNAPGTAPLCFKVLFSKVSLTLRKFKQIVEVPQVCLRNGALFFAFLEWL